MTLLSSHNGDLSTKCFVPIPSCGSKLPRSRKLAKDARNGKRFLPTSSCAPDSFPLIWHVLLNYETENSSPFPFPILEKDFKIFGRLIY